MTHPSATLPAKSHYEILDGLRGVAALMVVIFHMFEVFDGENRLKQIINHGYLAVDFFFLLSGFVVAYAYDDRWGKMTQGEFYTRRLIRLQPMVVMGTVIGAALFYLQRSPETYPLLQATPVWKMLLVMLVGFTMIPLLPSMDIRGWDETHPLDGPAWSLMYEYIANILYALGLRKLSNRALGIFVLTAGIFLVHLAIFGGRGDVIGGWALNGKQTHVGFARMLYPFFAGILLMRLGRRIHIREAFPVCSLMLIALFSIPRIGGPTHLWMNGLYDSFCIIVLFPLIVSMGAGGTVTGDRSLRLCRFFGEISYPLYITHYPLIYIYTGWVIRDHVSAARGALVGALLFFTSITIAYACLKLYDEPVREWLRSRFLVKTQLSGITSR